jgi:multiple sugar transport system substrate-binding protein
MADDRRRAREASQLTGAGRNPALARKEALMAGTMDRRSFLKVTGSTTAGLAGILASGRAPAYAQGQKLHMVRWVDFVPAADDMLKKQAVEAGKLLGAEVTIETINANDIQARITAAISSGTGADIFLLQHNLAHLYEKSLIDVGDVVDAMGKEQGGFYPAAEPLAKVNGVWRAAPHVVVGGLIAYRKSLFDEVGAKEFPKTWEAYREVGKKLKAKGFPIGQTAGHTFGDAPSFWYPMMWAFGGKEVDASGKTAINSKEMVEGVKFSAACTRSASTRAASPGTTPTTTGRSSPARSPRPSTARPSTSRP